MAKGKIQVVSVPGLLKRHCPDGCNIGLNQGNIEVNDISPEMLNEEPYYIINEDGILEPAFAVEEVQLEVNLSTRICNLVSCAVGKDQDEVDIYSLLRRPQ